MSDIEESSIRLQDMDIDTTHSGPFLTGGGGGGIAFVIGCVGRTVEDEGEEDEDEEDEEDTRGGYMMQGNI